MKSQKMRKSYSKYKSKSNTIKKKKHIIKGGKPKSSKRKKKKVICYTGVGAKSSGKYNETSFLKLMNKQFKVECGKSLNQDNCSPCKKHKKMAKEWMKMVSNPKMSNSKIDKFEKKLDSENEKCEKCKNINIKQCALNDYLNYSGAKYGKC